MPNNENLYFNIGVSLTELARHDEAISYYSKTIELNPSYTHALNNLANAYFMAGNMEAAVTRFNKLLDINPDSLEAHFNIGIILERKGNLKEAVKHFEEVLRIKPDFTKAKDMISRIKNKAIIQPQTNTDFKKSVTK